MSRLLSGLTGTIAKAGVAIAAGAVVFDNAVYTVGPGERAIIFDRRSGITGKVAGEGANLVVPFLQWPVIMDVRLQPSTINSETGTKDLQQVKLALRVLSRPSVSKLPTIFQTMGMDYRRTILDSISNEVLKAVVARYNADQLLTQRAEVSREIREAMTRRCTQEFNLVVDDVSITHLAFSPDFEKAIERKQVAEQMAERAKFVVAKAEQEKLALIVRSEGDAEAAAVVSQALQKNGQGLIELRRIETAQAVAQDLARNRNVTYLPRSGQNVLLNVDGAAGRK